ncbi:fibroblast growth factor receptor 4-like [Littorina saxatilis]|uniref:fibroblast growth factor receptor 4-like n=1 Tax=Littorina saxatilis TaxID=31220 RepID=UPI0038B516B3
MAPCAVANKAADDERKALQEELEQMLLVGPHPNIIQLIGSCMHDGSLHIIMELAEQGDLLNYLRQGKLRHEQYVSVGPDGTLREQKALHVTDHYELMLFSWHIAKGMSHLESVKCIHRDLAARNCLLTSGPAAKLSDFGLSRDVYENGYYLRHSKTSVILP